MFGQAFDQIFGQAFDQDVLAQKNIVCCSTRTGITVDGSSGTDKKRISTYSPKLKKNNFLELYMLFKCLSCLTEIWDSRHLQLANYIVFNQESGLLVKNK